MPLITATITGRAIQKVGFRAMIQKNAIMYNLAGSVRNNPDGSVAVALQGSGEQIEKVLNAIRAGSKRSSKNNRITHISAVTGNDIDTFTVFDWTSVSRNITSPYDLVFYLRPSGDPISHHEAKMVWDEIAEITLKGEDLIKFLTHLDADD